MRLRLTLPTSLIVLNACFLFSFSAFAEKFDRLIVFGDSLSDVGTYSEITSGQGGGKFTTNPGLLWIEIVAKNMSLSVNPYIHEGFGKPAKIQGGFNFAQGGARIMATAGSASTFTARSLSYQFDRFIKDNKEFKTTDIVFVQGGANDISSLLRDIRNKITTPEKALKSAARLADDLAKLLVKMNSAKANSVVVLNLPAMELAPSIQALDPLIQNLVAAMVKAFNQELNSKLSNKYFYLVDIYQFDKSVNDNYKPYGLTNVKQPACRLAELPQRSSLYCMTKNLVEPAASEKYKFADELHPTSGYSKIVGDFIWTNIKPKFKL